MIRQQTRTVAGIRDTMQCPHCWHVFQSGDTKWIAATESLEGDPKLGKDCKDKHPRFHPRRLTVSGEAIDDAGHLCSRVACPHCHLEIPRSYFELTPIFWSIIGPPGTGKSYVLASMTYVLSERTLPVDFKLLFDAADVTFNDLLTRHHNELFRNPESNDLVRIDKTGSHFDNINHVNYGNYVVQYARPFMFELCPGRDHYRSDRDDEISRICCLYDNAGEDFNPFADTVENQAAAHLAHSSVLMYLFDPTQDKAFRELCGSISTDPQLREAPETLDQIEILRETKTRIHRVGGIDRTRPLLMLITKYDVWKPLLENVDLVPPWKETEGGAELDVKLIREVSNKLRDLLNRHCPRVVIAAEQISNRVYYFPISATGTSPERNEKNEPMFRPADIKPIWVEVPILFTICQWQKKAGLIRSKV